MNDRPRFPEASRRTYLANERTELAWWRTGLTALAVSLGVGRLIPELGGGPNWPYAVIGAGYAVLGTGFIAYGSWRERAVRRAFERGGLIEGRAQRGTSVVCDASVNSRNSPLTTNAICSPMSTVWSPIRSM